MKSALIFLLAVLFLVTTPFMAAAHGGERQGERSAHSRDSVKQRHTSDHHYSNGPQWKRQAKRHFKQQRREDRHYSREDRHYRRSVKRYPVQRYVTRSYSAEPALVLAVPNIVFRLNW